MIKQLGRFSLSELLGLLAFFFASFLFFNQVLSHDDQIWLEDDMLWMIPLVSQIVETGSFSEILQFVFSLTDELGIPSLNFALVVMVYFFGANTAKYLLISCLLHIATAFVFYIFLRTAFQFTPLIATIGSVLFLYYAPQFHAYVWIIAIQHQFVLFSTLSTLILYFQNQNPNKKTIALFCFIGLFLSFLRISILILPVLIFFNILFRSKTNSELKENLYPFIPVLTSFFPVQLYFIAQKSSGDVIPYLLPISNLILNANIQLLFTLVGSLACAGALFYFGYSRIDLRIKKTGFSLLLFSPSLLVLYLFPNPHGAFLDLFAPFTSAIGFLFYPQTLFSSDYFFSRWHSINIDPSSFIGISNLFILIFFLICNFFSGNFSNSNKNRLLAFIIPWLLWTAPHLISVAANTNGFYPSRYFIYLGIPIILICLTPLSALLNFDPLRSPHPRLLIILKAAAVILCCTLTTLHFETLNTSIRQTRLASCFWSYDYAKFSQNLTSHLLAQRLTTLPQSLHVTGVETRFINHSYLETKKGYQQWDYLHQHPFYYTMKVVFTQNKINPSKTPHLLFESSQSQSPTFNFSSSNDELTYNKVRIDSFHTFHQQAFLSFQSHNISHAKSVIQKALITKPFFLKFFTSTPQSSFPAILESIYHNNGNRTLYELVQLSKKGEHHGVPDKDTRIQNLSAMLDREFDAYLEILFLSLYLKQNLEWKESIPYLINPQDIKEENLFTHMDNPQSLRNFVGEYKKSLIEK